MIFLYPDVYNSRSDSFSELASFPGSASFLPLAVQKNILAVRKSIHILSCNRKWRVGLGTRLSVNSSVSPKLPGNEGGKKPKM